MQQANLDHSRFRQCQVCFRTTSNASGALESHFKSCHIVKRVGNMDNKCGICAKKFHTFPALKQHFEGAHGKPEGAHRKSKLAAPRSMHDRLGWTAAAAIDYASTGMNQPTGSHKRTAAEAELDENGELGSKAPAYRSVSEEGSGPGLFAIKIEGDAANNGTEIKQEKSDVDEVQTGAASAEGDGPAFKTTLKTFAPATTDNNATDETKQADGQKSDKAQGPWVCVQCDGTFADMKAWQKHVREEHAIPTDENKGNPTQPASGQQEPTSSSSTVPDIVIVDNTTSKPESSSQNQGAGKPNTKCRLCERMVNGQQGLRTHAMQMAGRCAAHRKYIENRYQIIVKTPLLPNIVGNRKGTSKTLFFCNKCQFSMKGANKFLTHPCSVRQGQSWTANESRRSTQRVRKTNVVDHSQKSDEQLERESVLDFTPQFEGEDVIARVERTIQSKHAYRETEIQTDQEQVNILRRENQAIEKRMVQLNQECSGIYVDKTVLLRVQNKIAEINIMEANRAQMDHEFNVLRDEVYKTSHDLLTLYRSSIYDMEKRIEYLEREDRSLPPSDSPHRAASYDERLSPSQPPVIENSVYHSPPDPLRRPAVAANNNVGGMDPGVLSQMVSSMVQQAMSSFGNK